MCPSRRAEPEATLLCAKLLARWPLPKPDGDGDKEHRGTVLIVGGAPQMPGAAILAATAALRAGAGKLQIATCARVASLVAATVPEAYVESLPETRSGALAPAAFDAIARLASKAHAVLIGPGLLDESSIGRWLPRLVRKIAASSEATLVVDAVPLATLSEHPACLFPLEGRAVVTPHAGEMAAITGLAKSDVLRAPEAIARRTAAALHAVVALKGAVTFVAAPSGAMYRNEAGNVGLATSGSGDTLSGVVAGLAARGADPLRAAAWGVHLHACAGDRLAERTGGALGFLARELLGEIPRVMARLDRGWR